MHSEENKLYFRFGVQKSALSGSTWKEIRLKFANISKNEENEMAEKKSLIGSMNLNESISSTASNKADTLHQPIEEIKDLDRKTQSNESEIKYVPKNMSIYDDDPETDWIADLKDEIDASERDSKKIINHQNSIKISNYVTPINSAEIARTLNETDQKLDEILSNLIKSDINEPKDVTKEDRGYQLNFNQADKTEKSNINPPSRTSSILTMSSSDNQILNDMLASRQEHSRSISSLASLTSIQESEFVLINMIFCCANCFDLDSKTVPSRWFEKSIISSKFNDAEKEKMEDHQWKVLLIKDLNRRNFREFANIDKISILYENDVSYYFNLI